MITIRNVVKTYTDASETRVILDDLTLTIEQGASVSIQGASGSGKSTLLHLLGALDTADSGSINIIHKDSNLPANLLEYSEQQANQYRKTYVGIVFQKFNLIDCISVSDNILLPARLNNNIDESYINELLTTLGVDRHLTKQPSQLSGGEQQRVAIARALSHKPSLLLADEPTGNLDNTNAQKVSELLVETCSALNTSLVMVTHSASVASLCQHQYSLHAGKLTEA